MVVSAVMPKKSTVSRADSSISRFESFRGLGAPVEPEVWPHTKSAGENHSSRKSATCGVATASTSSRVRHRR